MTCHYLNNTAPNAIFDTSSVVVWYIMYLLSLCHSLSILISSKCCRWQNVCLNCCYLSYREWNGCALCIHSFDNNKKWREIRTKKKQIESFLNMIARLRYSFAIFFLRFTQGTYSIFLVSHIRCAIGQRK